MLRPCYLTLVLLAASFPAQAQEADPRGEMSVNERKVVDPSKQHFNEGNAAFKARDYQGALASYKKSIEANDQNANAFFGLGLSYRKLRKPKEALVALDRAVAIKPDHDKAISTRGSVKMDLRDYSGSVADYKAVIELRPRDVKTYFKLALAHDKQGSPAAAIGAYEKAVEIKPSYTKAHKNLGLLLEKQGDTAKAVTAFRHACEGSRSDASACTKWAENLTKLQRFSAAEKAAEKALERKPGDAFALVTLGEALEGQRLYDAALEKYEQAKNDPTWGPTAVYKIEALKKKRG
ncbi:MAG: hypothetical protein CME06_16915 [Gemmatimonadetes bacterium]|nr:hypothetical protein [Gemmatimonadota bacterium]